MQQIYVRVTIYLLLTTGLDGRVQWTTRPGWDITGYEQQTVNNTEPVIWDSKKSSNAIEQRSGSKDSTVTLEKLRKPPDMRSEVALKVRLSRATSDLPLICSSIHPRTKRVLAFVEAVIVMDREYSAFKHTDATIETTYIKIFLVKI